MTKADCPDGPCPFVGCRHHLAVVNITSTGRIQWHPTLTQAEEDEDALADQVTALPFGGCSLRAAAVGGMSLDEVASALAVSRQAVEQLEKTALARHRRAIRIFGFDRLGS